MIIKSSFKNETGDNWVFQERTRQKDCNKYILFLNFLATSEELKRSSA